MRLIEWFKNKYNMHYILYIICTLIWYIVNFFRVNGTGEQWAIGNELIGLTVFLILAMRYGARSFLKIPYVVCFGVELIGFVVFKSRILNQSDFYFQAVGRYVNACLCVVLLIRAFCYFFKEDKRNISIRLSFCYIVWALMMLSCVASRNKSTWPMWGIVMLGSMYVLPMKKEDKDAFVRGIVDGIIVNFFIYQGLALLHRPYEYEWLRYCSFFSNSDCSAKFFTVSYIGFLVKYLMLKKSDSKKVSQILAFLFASSMLAFMAFTLSRSGLLGMCAATIFFLIIKKLLLKESVIRVCRTGLAIIMTAIVAFPIVYLSIRYIPALRHHPIFIGEYSESRVHAWDPIDSDKYVSWEDVVNTFLNWNNDTSGTESYYYKRIAEIRNKYVDSIHSEEKGSEGTPKQGISEIKSLSINGERVLEYYDGVEPGKDDLHPAYIKKSYKNVIERKLGIRKYVFSYYFNKSSFRGNEEEYVSGVVLPGMTYTSAHNSVLDFMSRYGYVAGILFGVLQITVFVSGLIHVIENREDADDGVILAILVAGAYFAWGLFYSVAFTGEIMDTLFWISISSVMGTRKYRKATIGQ